METDVSVVIPAFNAAATIGSAIRSALEQTTPPAEVIVVDDGSTDDTAAIVGTFGSKVRLIGKENGGPGSARNAGIRAARATWIGLLDADDTWLPAKLERQLPLDTDPRIGIIACLSDKPGQVCPAEIGFDELWITNLLVNSTVLLRRSTWNELGGFDEARALISVEDYNLWLRVAAAGWRVVTLQEILARYTRGVGISSNVRAFLAASLFNLERIAQLLDLGVDKLRERRAAVLDQCAGTAFNKRDLALARALGLELARTNPTPSRLTRWTLAHLPAPILNTKRQLHRLLAAKKREDRLVSYRSDR